MKVLNVIPVCQNFDLFIYPSRFIYVADSGDSGVAGNDKSAPATPVTTPSVAKIPSAPPATNIWEERKKQMQLDNVATQKVYVCICV